MQDMADRISIGALAGQDSTLKCTSVNHASYFSAFCRNPISIYTFDSIWWVLLFEFAVKVTSLLLGNFHTVAYFKRAWL